MEANWGVEEGLNVCDDYIVSHTVLRNSLQMLLQGKEGQDLTWITLLAWDGPVPAHSLEGRFLDIGRCFCLCGFSLCDLYQMKFPSPLMVSS